MGSKVIANKKLNKNRGEKRQEKAEVCAREKRRAEGIYNS